LPFFSLAAAEFILLTPDPAATGGAAPTAGSKAEDTLGKRRLRAAIAKVLAAFFQNNDRFFISKIPLLKKRPDP
jgi:hypothetical protein